MWCAAMAWSDRLALAVLPQEVDADLEVRALHLAVDRLADVVQERGADGRVRVEAELPRHDAGEVRDLLASGSARSGRSSCGTSAGPSAGAPRGARSWMPSSKAAASPSLRTVSSSSAFTFSTTSSMRAGWMRPSAISRSIACRAISRRYGSKPERMIAPGVSSTIRSTPVAISSARMLRPSRPMMRPFRSSLGRSTTDTVVSMACSGALRWMASVTSCLARAVGRLAGLGLEALDQVGGVAPGVGLDLLEQQLLRLVGRQAGDALQLLLLLGDQLLVAGRGGRGGLLAVADRLLARAQLLLVLLGGRQPLGQLLLASCERTCSSRAACWRRVLGEPVGLHHELVRLLLGLEQRLLLARSRPRARRRAGASGLAPRRGRPSRRRFACASATQ